MRAIISKIRKNLGLQPRIVKDEAYVLYQQLCDEVFGPGVINIKPAPSNNVIGTLRYLDDFHEFKKNFKQRLNRLQKRFEGTAAYHALLGETWGQVPVSQKK